VYSNNRYTVIAVLLNNIKVNMTRFVNILIILIYGYASIFFCGLLTHAHTHRERERERERTRS